MTALQLAGSESFETGALPGLRIIEELQAASDRSASHPTGLRFLLGRQYVCTSLVAAAVFTDRVWQHRLAASWAVAELTDWLGIVCAALTST